MTMYRFVEKRKRDFYGVFSVSWVSPTLGIVDSGLAGGLAVTRVESTYRVELVNGIYKEEDYL